MKKVEYSRAIRRAPFYFTRQELAEELTPYPEHNHDYYEFFLVASGRVRHRFNGREAVLPAGTLQLIRPDDTHQVQCDRSSFSAVIYNCNIKKEEFIPLFSYLISSDRCSVDDLVQTVAIGDSPEFAALARRIERVLEMQETPGLPDFLGNAFSRSIQQEVLCVFLDRTVRSVPAAPEWLETVFLEMRKPENFLTGLPRMVELSGRSREHLARALKSQYGVTPREYLLELKLRHATLLLAESGLSILEAATRAGFQNMAYFRKCFRARFGITPHLYRKRYKGD